MFSVPSQVSDHSSFLELVLVTRVALHLSGIKLSQDFLPAGVLVLRFCTIHLVLILISWRSSNFCANWVNRWRWTKFTALTKGFISLWSQAACLHLCKCIYWKFSLQSVSFHCSCSVTITWLHLHIQCSTVSVNTSNNITSSFGDPGEQLITFFSLQKWATDRNKHGITRLMKHE